MTRFIKFFLTVFSINGFSQVALLDKCYDFIQQREFDKAESAVLLAEKNVVTANDARTYYLKSFIYKEMLLLSDVSEKKHQLQNKAIQAIKLCKQLDHDNSLSQPVKQLNNFLSACAYNDGTENFNKQKYGDAIVSFRQYIDLNETRDDTWLDANYFVGASYYNINRLDSAMYFLELVKERNYDEPILFVDLTYLYLKADSTKALSALNEGLSKYPDYFDLKIAELNVLSRLLKFDTLEMVLEKFLSQHPDNTEALLLAGTTYDKLKSEETHLKYFNKSEKVYKQIIQFDSLHYDANYNLGVLYYNEAVDIVNKSNLETNIQELNKILEKSTLLFEQSLPLLLKIYRRLPNNQKPDLKLLKALQAIYYNLNMKSDLANISTIIKSLNQ